MSDFEEQLVSARSIQDSIQGYIFLRGRNNVLLSAPHAQGPSADNFTGEIAFKVAEITDSGMIASTLSREKLDYNHSLSRNAPYRQLMKEELFRLHRRYGEVLLLDIHGVATRPGGPSIYLGTQFGKTASPTVIDLVLEAFWSIDVDATLASLADPALIGGDIVGSLSDPREGRHAIQIEIDQRHRKVGSGEEIVKGLVIAIKRFEESFPSLIGLSAILRRLKGVHYPIKSLETFLGLLSRDGKTIPVTKKAFIGLTTLADLMDTISFPVLSPKELMRELGRIWSTIRESSKAS